MESVVNDLAKEIVKSFSGRSKMLKKYLALLRTFHGYISSGWSLHQHSLKDINEFLLILVELVKECGDKSEEKKIWRLSLCIMNEFLHIWGIDDTRSLGIYHALMTLKKSSRDSLFSCAIHRYLGIWSSQPYRRIIPISRNAFGGTSASSFFAITKKIMIDYDQIEMSKLFFIQSLEDTPYPEESKRRKSMIFGSKNQRDNDLKLREWCSIISALCRFLTSYETFDNDNYKKFIGKIMPHIAKIQKGCSSSDPDVARHTIILLGILSQLNPVETIDGVHTSLSFAIEFPNHDTLLSSLQAVRASTKLLAYNPTPEIIEMIITDLLNIAVKSTNIRISCEAIIALCGNDESMGLKMIQKDKLIRMMMNRKIDICQECSKVLYNHLQPYYLYFDITDMNNSNVDNIGDFYSILRVIRLVAQTFSSMSQISFDQNDDNNNNKSAMDSPGKGTNSLLDLDALMSIPSPSSSYSSNKNNNDNKLMADGTQMILLNPIYSLLSKIIILVEDIRMMMPLEPLRVHSRKAMLKTMIWLLPLQSSSSIDSFSLVAKSSTEKQKAFDSIWNFYSGSVDLLFTEIGISDALLEPLHHTDMPSNISSNQMAILQLLADIGEELLGEMLSRLRSIETSKAIMLVRCALDLAERLVCLCPKHESCWYLLQIWTEVEAMCIDNNNIDNKKKQQLCDLLQKSVWKALDSNLSPSQSALSLLDSYKLRQLSRASQLDPDNSNIQDDDDADGDDENQTVDNQSQTYSQTHSLSYSQATYDTGRHTSSTRHSIGTKSQASMEPLSHSRHTKMSYLNNLVHMVTFSSLEAWERSLTTLQENAFSIMIRLKDNNNNDGNGNNNSNLTFNQLSNLGIGNIANNKDSSEEDLMLMSQIQNITSPTLSANCVLLNCHNNSNNSDYNHNIQQTQILGPIEAASVNASKGISQLDDVLGMGHMNADSSLENAPALPRDILIQILNGTPVYAAKTPIKTQIIASNNMTNEVQNLNQSLAGLGIMGMGGEKEISTIPLSQQNNTSTTNTINSKSNDKHQDIMSLFS